MSVAAGTDSTEGDAEQSPAGDTGAAEDGTTQTDTEMEAIVTAAGPENGKKKTAYDNAYDTKDMNTIFSEEKQFHGIMKKYWNQRHDLFSRYDDGVLLTKELWFSVTPEVISRFTARVVQHVFESKNEPIFVMDAFAGGGGNVNLFLEYFDVVFAVDINHIHLHCTKNNAAVYFPSEKLYTQLKLLPLNWVYADETLDEHYVDEHYESMQETSELVDRVYANKEESQESLDILKDVRLDCIFGSPPWGGPEYIRDKYYNLNNILPYPLEKLLSIFLHYTDNVCLFLPKNSNLVQIQKITQTLFHDEKYVRVLRMSVHGRQKGLLCCWGPAFVDFDLQDVQL